MGDDLENGLPVAIDRTPEPDIPDHDQPIIRAAGEDVRVHLVPGHVLDRGTVMQDLHHRGVLVVLLLVLLHVPYADPFVALPGDQHRIEFRVPAQAVAFLGVADELRDDFTLVLAQVGQDYLAIGVGGGDDRRVHMAAASPVDLAA